MTTDERLTRLETMMEAQNVQLASISGDVKSLLQSRAFSRGVAKTAGWISTVVSMIIGAIGLLIHWRTH